MDTELRCLTHAAARACGLQAPLPHYPQNVAGIRRLLALAQQHKSTEHLALAADIPPQIRTPLQLQRMRSRASRLLITSMLPQLLTALQEQGYQPLLFKGPALSCQLYGSAVRREFRDIDMLVHPWNPPGIDRIMQQLGYRPHADAEILDSLERSRTVYIKHELEYVHRQTGCSVELHARAWKNHHALFPVSQQDLYADAVTVTADLQDRQPPHELRTFSPTHHTLYSIAHAASHGFCLLTWNLDIAVALRDHHDPQALLQEAHRLHMERSLATAVHLLTRTLRIELPEPWKTVSQSRRSAPRHCTAFATSQYRSSGARLYTPFTSMRTQLRFLPALSTHPGTATVAMLFKYVFIATRGDYKWIRLPQSLHFLYPAAHLAGTLARMIDHWIPTKRRKRK